MLIVFSMFLFDMENSYRIDQANVEKEDNLMNFKLGVMTNSDETLSSSKEELKSTDENKSKSDEEKNSSGNTEWNLEDLFANDEEWEKEVKSFLKGVEGIKKYQKNFFDSDMSILTFLQVKENLDIKLDKLYAYAKLSHDVNKNDYKYTDMMSNLETKAKEYSAICTKFEKDIVDLSNKEYKKIISSNKLEKYKKYLEDIRKQKEHYLDSKSEEILSKVASIGVLPSKLYEVFSNMDRQTDMTPAEYSSNIESTDRNKRKEAYEKEYSSYAKNINVLSGLMNAQVQKNVLYSELRNFDSALQMYLEPDGVDEKIYDNLIKKVDENLSSMHKYISLRKKVLNLDKLKLYDMNVSIVKEPSKQVEYSDAQEMVYSALMPLGKEYSDCLYTAFNKNWIDVYSSKNKVGGGYCLSVYDNHPYVLINYNNSIKSVSTLAHELGHAVYGYMSSKNQDYYYANPSILNHEVASITNEMLLYEKNINDAKTDDEKAYYLSEYIDLIKNTLFIQTMYSEFEKDIHEKVAKEETLNAEKLNNIWGSLIKKYYGKDYEEDDISKMGWARIPHFYSSFYVYKYATGCIAANLFLEDINKNGSENYINYLKEGSSNEPIETLKKHNIDLTKSKAIDKTIDKFNSLVEELEKLL